MDFTGRYLISAQPDRVWEAINDPAILQACIPGCQQLDKTSPTEFVATAKLKIGPVGATFKGKVQLTDLDPPHSCNLSGEGQGGVAGFAKGSAHVVLTPEGNGTVLTYTAKASVGGKLAQIGQRLIDGAAKQVADDFFKRFAAALEAPAVLTPDPTTDESIVLVAATPGTGSMEAAGMPLPPVLDEPRTGLQPVVWVAGLIAVIALLLLAVSRLT